VFDVPQFWEVGELRGDGRRPAARDRVFIFEQRRERRNEEDEVYQLLSNAYNDFLRVVIDNPDLRLRSQSATPDLSPSSRSACS
jgi:hypothetical protein